MKRLRYWIWVARAAFFKFVFGIDPRWLQRSIANYKAIFKALEAHQQYLNSLEASIIQLRRQTGGDGWPETIQAAIGQLSQRVEYHREVLQTHQDNLAQLSQLEAAISPQIESKKDWN